MYPSPVSPGDPIRADDWNALLDTLTGLPDLLQPAAGNAIVDGQSVALRAFVPREALILLTITGNLAGGGQYTARSLRGHASSDGASNLSLPQGLQTAASDDLIFLNPPETGTSFHTLPTGTYRLGRIVGAATAGRLLVIGDAIPVTLDQFSDVTLTSPSTGDLLRYDAADHQWKKLTPTTLTVVTDYRVSGLTLQKKTRAITILAAEAESAWTTVHTGTTCP